MACTNWQSKGLNECAAHDVLLPVLWRSGIALLDVQNALISKQLIIQPEKIITKKKTIHAVELNQKWEN